MDTTLLLVELKELEQELKTLSVIVGLCTTTEELEIRKQELEQIKKEFNFLKGKI